MIYALKIYMHGVLALRVTKYTLADAEEVACRYSRMGDHIVRAY
jgi:hypothetical protein